MVKTLITGVYKDKHKEWGICTVRSILLKYRINEDGDTVDEKDPRLFNEVYREISEIMGTDGAIAIYEMYKGQQISFPVHLFSSKRIYHNIIKEYDGTNTRELSKRYGYSEKTVRRIIKEESDK